MVRGNHRLHDRSDPQNGEREPPPKAVPSHHAWNFNRTGGCRSLSPLNGLNPPRKQRRPVATDGEGFDPEPPQGAEGTEDAKRPQVIRRKAKPTLGLGRRRAVDLLQRSTDGEGFEPSVRL